MSLLRGEVRSDFITVEEAADRLGLSVASVRRRCASGELDATKAGSQWLVNPAALGNVGAKRRRRASELNPTLDYKKALQFVQATDLNELWVPDLLRFRDALQDESIIAKIAERRVASLAFNPVVRIDVPKTLHSNRPAVLLDLPDRVALQAVVQAMSEPIEAHLGPNIFSSRRDRAGKYFLEHGTRKWVRFKTAVRDHAEEMGEGAWVASADVSAYFEHVIHKILFEELSAAGAAGMPLKALRAMLSRWALVEGVGLPQGPNAARVLGNFYMVGVDNGMGGSEYGYFRFMDDVRIVAKTKPAAVAALREFERLCRARGLTVSSAKTSVKPIVKYIEEDDDADIDQAEYFFKRTPVTVSRKKLKQLLKKALEGERINERRAKFSIWRLARIRERDSLGGVLGKLEHLAPLASPVAAYLKPFVCRPHVRKGLEEFLSDDSRSYSPYLRTWIYVALLEGRTVAESSRAIAAKDAMDRNNPSYLRAVAICVVGRASSQADVYWMRNEIDREHDPAMLRALLVALHFSGELSRSVANVATARMPELGFVCEWLRGRTSMPSLLFANQDIRL